MVAGLNLLGEIWDFNYPDDDDIGGAQPSGTILYKDVEMRIQANKPTQALLEQGIVGINTYVGLIANHTLDVENNNEIRITAPQNSPFYNEYFRILGDPQRTSTGASDSRGYLLVNLQRVERGRTIQ